MIDFTDRKILYFLDANSSSSNTALAKKVGISKQLLAYRLDRLFKEGIVERCYTVINSVKLGYLYFRMYFKFQGLASEKECAVMANFSSSQYVTWVVRCRGNWDVVVSMYARDTEHFFDAYHSLIDEFQKHILSKKIVLMHTVQFSTRKYFSKEETSVNSVYGGVTQNVVINKYDHAILKELSNDSRIGLVRLAKKVDLHVDTVRSHITNLEKQGIIKGHKAVFDFSKMGFLFFIVSVTLSNATETARNRFDSYCRTQENVVYIVDLLGDHDIDLEVEVESQEEMDMFLRDLQNTFHEIIRDVSVIQITKQHKLDYYPFERSDPPYV